ncbi:hypothetical protein [Pontibacter sp. SGAir0037]|uniref:hypothetical protein n=1 Tax=Pontibacter sp. SGAir0037 TaxID=2571030 RepID=UPI0010CCFEB0|nr:hypothetical protein [Pontibacter sp. SGAir0037]QCR21749.1 hypothetical protein C1N53_04925 [Pontibacter sp. SGAir0037]
MHYKLSLLILFWMSPLFVFCGYAQSDSVQHKSLYIKFSPQHLAVNAYVLEIEKAVKPAARHSIVLTPSLYNGETWFTDAFTSRDSEAEDYAHVKGYGAQLMHRVYSRGSSLGPNSRLYVSYGVSYHQFNIGFEKLGWKEETGDDGLDYYIYRARNHEERISRMGILGTAGLQGPVISDRIVGDIYVGVTYKNSHIDTNYTKVRYNENYLDYGYTGVHLIGGIKIGIAF